MVHSLFLLVSATLCPYALAANDFNVASLILVLYPLVLHSIFYGLL